MWELDHKEGWAPKNWCFWTVELEKTLENPVDCKEIQPVNPKGNQSWIFSGRTDAEAGAPILWLPDVKNWLIGKDPDAGKDWGQEEKGMTEDEIVGWHHRLDGHEFGQALGAGDGQGGLAGCSPWGGKELDMTERLNWAELTETIKRSVVARGWVRKGEDEEMKHRGFLGSETTLDDTMMLDTCRYTFIQTQRMCTSQSDSYGSWWALGDWDVSVCVFIGSNKCNCSGGRCWL